jgi:hypothetical protein
LFLHSYICAISEFCIEKNPVCRSSFPHKTEKKGDKAELKLALLLIKQLVHDDISFSDAQYHVAPTAMMSVMTSHPKPKIARLNNFLC